MNIEIIRHPDCEGNDNRGFCVDALELLVDGDPAGYLNMSYIPLHRVIQWDGIKSAEIALDFQASLRNLTPEKFLLSKQSLGLPPLISSSKMEKLWQELDGKGNLNGGGIISFHVDRPLVDYIRIYKPGDFINKIPPLVWKSYDNGIQNTKNYRNKGLGILLYLEGAKWMSEKGMFLHSSALQSEEAKKSWSILRTKFPQSVKNILAVSSGSPKNKSRTILVGNTIPDWRPKNSNLVIKSHEAGRPYSCLNFDDLIKSPFRVGDMIENYKNKLRISEGEGNSLLGGEHWPLCPQESLDNYYKNNIISFNNCL